MPISDKIMNAKMAELGRIKIGGLGEMKKSRQGKDFQMPTKFEHFVITGQERDKSGNFAKDESIHALVGQEPRELKIRLLYNDLDLNFRTELAYYQGKTCLCRGDGVTAQRSFDTEVQCPCPKLDQEKNGCKWHGVLNCLLEDASICGGVYRFSTTSKNTIRSIVSALKFIKACNGGIVAGIPLVMKYFKKTTQTKDGKATTIPVVTIIYKGSPVEMLETAIKTEKERIQAGVYMRDIEKVALLEMRNTTADPILMDDEVPEFHPDNEDAPETTLVPNKTIDDIVKKPASKPKTKTKAKVTEPKPEPTEHELAEAEAEAKTEIPTFYYSCSQCPTGKVIQKPEQSEEKCTKCGATLFPCKTPSEMAEKIALIEQQISDAETKKTLTPDPAVKQELLSLPDAQKGIMRLRAKNRLGTDDFNKLAKLSGITTALAGEWTTEEANKMLQALTAKYGAA